MARPVRGAAWALFVARHLTRDECRWQTRYGQESLIWALESAATGGIHARAGARSGALAAKLSRSVPGGDIRPNFDNLATWRLGARG